MALSYVRITPANINNQAIQNRLNRLNEIADNTPLDLRCSPFGNIISKENITLYAMDPYDAGLIAAVIVDESNNPIAIVLAQNRQWRQVGDLWIAALDIRPDLGGRYGEVFTEIATAARNAGFLRFGGKPRPSLFFSRLSALPNTQILYGDELWVTV